MFWKKKEKREEITKTNVRVIRVAVDDYNESLFDEFEDVVSITTVNPRGANTIFVTIVYR